MISGDSEPQQIQEHKMYPEKQTADRLQRYIRSNEGIQGRSDGAPDSASNGASMASG